MTGIKDIQGYVPAYRLARSEIVRAHDQKQLAAVMKGARAVASFDEDSLTMSVEAALALTERNTAAKIRGLLWASTTSPYGEKSGANLVATVAGLDRATRTADFAGSMRSGGDALLSAADFVRSNRDMDALVVAADSRIAEPGSVAEHLFGDGAAAAVLGTSDLICELISHYSLTSEITDIWRTANERFVRSGDERFSSVHGYTNTCLEVMKGFFESTGASPDAISRVICYAPDAQSHAALGKGSGRPEKFFKDTLLERIGNTGTPSVFLQMIEFLRTAKIGDSFLVVFYGSGAHALLFRTTDALSEWQRGSAPTENPSIPLPTYERYLKFKDLIERPRKEWDLKPFTSQILLWRENDDVLRLIGNKCTRCASIVYPPRPLCPKCGNGQAPERVELSRNGTVFTFNRDHVYPGPEPPVTMAVVDLDGGGRFFTQMTDDIGAEPRIGMRVRLVFRKFHEAGGFHNYFWKARPRGPA